MSRSFGQHGVRFAKIGLFSGVSIASLLLSSNQALANCSPNPASGTSTVTCSGNEPGGLGVTGNAVVNLPAGASIQAPNSGTAAIRVSSALPGASTSGNFPTLNINGTVTGGAAGVSVDAATAQLPASINPKIVIGATGLITGVSGIALIGNLANPQFSATQANIVNSGTISGTGGFAMVATNPSRAYFTTIDNLASGRIGAINAYVQALTNAGVIDGGANSAYRFATGLPYFAGGQITNSGTITSANGVATIAPGFGLSSSAININNAGRIINTGGGKAIVTTGPLFLTNRGTIIGGIDGTYPYSDFLTAFPSGHQVDTSNGGTITGGILFGPGADTLIADFATAANPVAGVTGTIDGGNGIDTLRLRIAAATTISTPIAMPNAFERLGLQVEQGVTTTLAGGFAQSGGLRLSGLGTIIISAALSGASTIVSSSEGIRLVNRGSIVSNGAPGDFYAVNLLSANSLINDGAISSSGNGLYFSGSGTITNNGIITATGSGTAANLGTNNFGTANAINNGTIRSIGGTGVVSGGLFVNASGARIEGVIGATGTVTNFGTILGSTTGAIGNVDNRAGGVITGGTTAIGPAPTGPFQLISGMTVQNAGTINGTANFRSIGYTFATGNRFYALPGGVLNGNLILGIGDMVIVELAGSSGSRLAGINGTVSGSSSELRYRVRANSAVAAGSLPGFSTTSYELYDGSQLTVNGAAANQRLQFAGIGTVNLAANITALNQAPFQLTGLASGSGYGGTTLLDIVNRGTLAITHSDNNTSTNLLGGRSFTNEGMITLIDTTTSQFLQNALVLGTQVLNADGTLGATAFVNRGTIAIAGNAGFVNGADSLANSGTMTQTGTMLVPAAVQGVKTITNGGTIRVAGTGLLYSTASSSLINSGTIASTGGVAVRSTVTFNTFNNLTSGVISGGPLQPAMQLAGGIVTNAGAINGDVDLSYSSFGGIGAGPGAFVSAGGTLNGNLRFGSGNDIFIETGRGTGVTGTIDAGAGFDLFGHSRTGSATVALGGITGLNFEAEMVEAKGADAVVRITAPSRLGSTIYLAGGGTIINDAATTGSLLVGNPFFSGPWLTIDGRLAGLTNNAAIGAGVSGTIGSFANTASIASAGTTVAVRQTASGRVGFANSGQIAAAGTGQGVLIQATGVTDFDFVNSGTITSSGNGSTVNLAFAASDTHQVADISNTGTISGRTGLAVTVTGAATDGLAIVNGGTLSATGVGGIGLAVTLQGGTSASLTNSGTIQATGGAPAAFPNVSTVSTSTGLLVQGTRSGGITVTNASSGVIAGSGANTIALLANNAALTLINDGMINGAAGTVIPETSQLYQRTGLAYLAGAIQTFGGLADTIDNRGTITGSIDLDGGDDIIVNRGRIDGDLFLRGGDDSLWYALSGAITGIADGGDGFDVLAIDLTGDGTFDPARFLNFEAIGFTGNGTLATSGALAVDSVTLAGGHLQISAGQSLETAGPNTITGTAANETVTNAGTIAGSVALAAGNDTVINSRTIAGSLLLGEGDDSLINTGRIGNGVDFGDGNDALRGGGTIAGQVQMGAGDDSADLAALVGAAGGIDGGAGNDLLRINAATTANLTATLAGRLTNFESMQATGTGTINAEGSFSVASVLIDGATVNVAAGTAFGTVGANAITGGTAADRVVNAGTIAGGLDLGAGADQVTNSGTITGSLTLGDGSDSLVNTGAIGGGVDFGDGGDSLTGGGTIAGPVRMGVGDDAADLAALAGAAGGIDGGAGSDLLRIDATTAAQLTAVLAGKLTSFETMQAAGGGTINAAGSFSVTNFLVDGATVNVASGTSFGIAGANAITGGANGERVVNAGTILGGIDLGDGANQVTNQGAIVGGVTMGAGNDSLTNGGTITGPVDLGAGANTLVILDGAGFGGRVTAGSATSDVIQLRTSGTYAAPAGFNGSQFTGFETLQNLAGTNQLSGSFGGAIDVTGGYLFGAAGSVIGGNVSVGAGARFGTSGLVNGDVAVASGATLAPGSSPGVMTVNGNVSLAAGSTTTFEFVPSPGQSDQLLISGNLGIAANTTLNLTGARPLTPGVNYDLIVANGGITGTFATVNQPATIGGFLRYTANRLQLMGTFLSPAGVTLQQAAAINFINGVMVSGQASPAFLAAVPSLLRADGAANPAVFNLLTAEAYASASQLGVENALTLAQAGRTGIARTTREDAGVFLFAQGTGDRRTLRANAATGTSRARSESWGVLGGIGYGADGASIGAFIGHLDSRQRITALGVTTNANGMVAGLAGHFATEGFEFGLLGAYDWTKAETGRSVPGGRVDSSRYRLGSLTLDASVGANIPLGTDWVARPEAGVTHVRGHRGAAREIGNAAFALDIDRDRFAATFVDTSIALKGGQAEGATLHPWLQAGIRRQIAGRAETANGGFVGRTSRLSAVGAGRKEKVLTAGAGLSYDIGGVTLYAAYQSEFGGGNGHNGNVGVRFGF